MILIIAIVGTLMAIDRCVDYLRVGCGHGLVDAIHEHCGSGHRSEVCKFLNAKSNPNALSLFHDSCCLIYPFEDVRDKHPAVYDFDASMGFPGEGWVLTSINVGSLEKHSHIAERHSSCICVQETRLTQTSLRSFHKKMAERDWVVEHGAPMKYLPSGAPEYGGVAILNGVGTSRPFAFFQMM